MSLRCYDIAEHHAGSHSAVVTTDGATTMGVYLRFMDEDERRWLFEDPPSGDESERVALAIRDEWDEDADEPEEMIEPVADSLDDE